MLYNSNKKRANSMTPDTTKSKHHPSDDLRVLTEDEAHAHGPRADGTLHSAEVRSSPNGIAQMMLQLMPGDDTAVQGVGGRRGSTPQPPIRGGFPDNCNVF